MLIYALVDPRTNKIRYVGLTTSTLAQRRRYHIYLAVNKKEQSPKSAWIRLLHTRSLEPTAILLQSNATWEDEVKWIARFRRDGANLFNKSGGGEGGPSNPRKRRT